MSVQQLHLPYCNITAEAGPAIGEMITYAKCGLVTLNLMVRRPSLPHPSSSLREKRRRMTR